MKLNEVEHEIAYYLSIGDEGLSEWVGSLTSDAADALYNMIGEMQGDGVPETEIARLVCSDVAALLEGREAANSKPFLTQTED